LSKKEPLHEALKPYVIEGGFMPMLKHPLVFHVPYHEQMNALANKQYEQKKNATERYLKEEKYDSYVFIHERPYRLSAFLNIYDKMKPKEFWEMLSDIWRDSENIWQNKSTYKMLFSYHPKSKHHFMSKEDRKVFDSLPEQVVVYRGFTVGKNKNGFSYTLDKSRAEWFANRFNKNGKVLERTISKDKIVAYTNGRGEQEVIIIS
jgi:hypothetical protein